MITIFCHFWFSGQGQGTHKDRFFTGNKDSSVELRQRQAKVYLSTRWANRSLAERERGFCFCSSH
jgi:hypothetical protein